MQQKTAFGRLWSVIMTESFNEAIIALGRLSGIFRVFFSQVYKQGRHFLWLADGRFDRTNNK